jgi:hypothetical protein
MVYVVVKDPHGVERWREGISLPRFDASATAIRHGIATCKLQVDNAGVWSVAIESGAHVLATLPIEVRHVPLQGIG